MVYHIYTARKPNGDSTALAIDPTIIGVPDRGRGLRLRDRRSPAELSKIEDWFVSGTTEIEKAGEIEVEGNLYLLDNNFCVRS